MFAFSKLHMYIVKFTIYKSHFLLILFLHPFLILECLKSSTIINVYSLNFRYIDVFQFFSYYLITSYPLVACSLFSLPSSIDLNHVPGCFLHGRHLRLDKKPGKSYGWNSSTGLPPMYLIGNSFYSFTYHKLVVLPYLLL